MAHGGKPKFFRKIMADDIVDFGGSMAATYIKNNKLETYTIL